MRKGVTGKYTNGISNEQKHWSSYSVLANECFLLLRSVHRLCLIFIVDSLKCREAGIAFGVEVIRHEVSDIGAILLYHNNQRLVTVAYSIDGSELPSRIQVS